MDNRRIMKMFTDEFGEVDMLAVLKERDRIAKAYGKTDRGRFGRYKHEAQVKKLKFKLSEAEFIILLHKDCDYCGIPNALGVDRIDSALGYLTSNAVPCCTMCNMMKRTYPKELFIEQCKRIASRF